MPCTLVTGPVRSGKSRFAESLAAASGGRVLYVATGRIDDDDAEWVARIAHHVASRPADWRVVETARAGAPSLAEIAREARSGETLLVDSLGTWLADRISRRLEAGGETAALDAPGLEAEAVAALAALLASPAPAIVVGEEVGWGLVPDFPSGRIFRDVLGRMQQRLAGRATATYLVVAGFAIEIGALGTRVEAARALRND